MFIPACFPYTLLALWHAQPALKAKFILLAGSEGTRWTWRCVAAEEFKEIEDHYSVLAKTVTILTTCSSHQLVLLVLVFLQVTYSASMQ